MRRFATQDAEQREEGIAAAAAALQRGRLVVIPTDTVYGLAADAFDADAVSRLLAAKGRGRQMPPPVLVAAATTLDALAVGVAPWARTLTEELWPGPFTLIVRQQASLQWDLGDTRGTVAVRMPDHADALELLQRTGPLAVSSANLTGRPPATTADEAEAMLSDFVAVLVDGGPTPGAVPSTIVDATGVDARVLRRGVVGNDRLREILDPLGVRLVDPLEEAVDRDEPDEPEPDKPEPDEPAADELGHGADPDQPAEA